MLDEIDYFLNNIEFFCLNTKSEEIFKQKNKHIFVGISPFNSYFSDTFGYTIKFLQMQNCTFTFFYVEELAKYTLEIIKPHYSENKKLEELKHQRRNVKNRLTQELKNFGYSEIQIKEIYKEFSDFKEHPVFIENFKKTLEKYNLKTELYNFCNKLVFRIIENAKIDKNIVSKEAIEYSHLYFLNEIALINSLNLIFDNKNIILPYHTKDIIEIFDFVESDVGTCFLNIKPKKTYTDQITKNINIFILDKNMKYRLINEKMLKTINEINNTSLSKNQILNKTYFEIFNVDGNDLLEIDKNIINNQVVYEKEEIAKIKNKTKYFKTLKQPFYNEKGDVIGLIGYSTDITEIKEAQIKAEKEKEYELSFNQNYVHEVNNIFHKKTQIKYLLSIESILEKEKADLLESLEHLENVHFQLMQNFSLHHNNLLQEKEIFLEKKSVNIIKLIEKEIRYFNLCYKYLNQDRIIIFEKSLDNFELTIDETKISQVVHNLIKNADKHSESTKINVKCLSASLLRLGALQDICYLSFEDNGIGISKEIDKESLFIVDKNKKITKSGSGLGLPICKSIIGEHGGDISFKEVEKGVAIEFWLPY